MKIPQYIFVFIIIFLVLFQNCVITTSPDEKELKMTMEKDTISPYSSIRLCFSSSLRDTSDLRILFKPQIFEYYAYLNTKNDTLIISHTVPLQGKSRYILRPQGTIISESANTVSGNDSVCFFTYPLENEPNNTIYTADTLFTRIFGSVANVDDIDIFVIKDPKILKISLKSFESRSTFQIQDNNGRISMVQTYKDSMIVPVPDSFSVPIYLQVYSYRRSSGGYYQAQCIK